MGFIGVGDVELMEIRRKSGGCSSGLCEDDVATEWIRGCSALNDVESISTTCPPSESSTTCWRGDPWTSAWWMNREREVQPLGSEDLYHRLAVMRLQLPPLGRCDPCDGSPGKAWGVQEAGPSCESAAAERESGGFAYNHLSR